jgi:hypothetical protein
MIKLSRIFHIVDFSCGNDDYGRDAATQIQKGMELYRTLPFPKLCPGEKGQAKVDSGRIQGVNCLIQFDTEGIFGV